MQKELKKEKKMIEKKLSIEIAFSEEHFEQAYMMLQMQFKEQTPPREFFLGGQPTVVNLSQLDENNAHQTCQYMLAAKISFVAAEALSKQHSSILGQDGKPINDVN